MIEICVIDLERTLDEKCEKYYLEHSKKQFQKEGITVISNQLTNEILNEWIKGKQICHQKFIVITDSEASLIIAKKWNIASIGYWRKDSIQNLTLAKVLLESFEGLDLKYLEYVRKRTFHEPITIMHTKHLEIRELTVSDMRELYELYQNTKNSEFLKDAKDSLDEMEQKQEAYIKNIYEFYDFGLWGVFFLENNKLIGRCGIQSSEIGGIPIIEVGYFIGDAYQKNGYGKEAVLAVLQYAKEQLDLRKITAFIQESNCISIHVAKSIGFVESGKIRRYGKKINIYEKRI